MYEDVVSLDGALAHREERTAAVAS